MYRIFSLCCVVPRSLARVFLWLWVVRNIQKTEQNQEIQEQKNTRKCCCCCSWLFWEIYIFNSEHKSLRYVWAMGGGRRKKGSKRRGFDLEGQTHKKRTFISTNITTIPYVASSITTFFLLNAFCCCCCCVYWCCLTGERVVRDFI